MPTLTITVAGHLLVAGSQASDLGVDLATARRFNGKELVPYIPATAVRGAVRIQLEALLRGASRGAVDPYPDPPEPGPVDPVARLFGYSGPLRQRDQAREGALRFGDALPADDAAALSALAVRPGLELDDQTGSAASHKLFFREVAELGEQPLVFTARLWIREPEDEQDAEQHQADIKLLRAAITTTDALGAGKSKGGGAISIAWSDETAIPATRSTGDAATATRARLILTLAEPAHFGDGGPRGNHHATRVYIPGSTVRGAVAWSLLRGKRLTPVSPEFRALFLNETAPVSFGDAVLAQGSALDRSIRPATRRHLRGNPAAIEDTLVAELARERVNRLLAEHHVYLRADDGDQRFEPAKARLEEGIVRRTRTRVSIDRWKGVSADGRLFSIEQIEPWLLDGAHGRAPARFVSLIQAPPGATPSPLRSLALLEGLPLLIGAGRNHGLGLVEVEVRFESEPQEAPSLPSLLALGDEVDRCATRFAHRAGVLGTEEIPPAATVPVALIALSDYVPSGGGVRHPLAEPGLGASDLASLAPTRQFLNPSASGGYDQIPGHAPLKDLLPAIGAGSVLVYEIDRRQLPALATLLPALGRGVGSRVDSGCGRFLVFEPPAEDER
jgi:CRISPR/Cas system CSM-associated protein Csm3 (group 7 of RAMP superfamily)